MLRCADNVPLPDLVEPVTPITVNLFVGLVLCLTLAVRKLVFLNASRVFIDWWVFNSVSVIEGWLVNLSNS